PRSQCPLGLPAQATPSLCRVGKHSGKIEAPSVRQRQHDALSFSQGGFKRHCQSRSENETALAAPADVTRRMST
ncbi:MAG: hypothetical protein ACXVBG_04395, partial [Isosphaeraceae bacterium]